MGRVKFNQEEDARLCRLAQAGDGKAREEMVYRYMPLIKKVCLMHTGYDPDELVSVGVTALLEAIDRYDATVGAKFLTLAYIYVWGQVKRHTVRSPRTGQWANPVHVFEDRAKLFVTEDRMALSLGREATVEELSRELGWKTERLQKARLAETTGYLVNLDENLCRDRREGTLTREEVTPGSMGRSVDDVLSEMETEAMLKRLSDRERRIVRELMKGKVMAQVARDMGLTRERVRQIVNRIKEKIEPEATARGLL